MRSSNATEKSERIKTHQCSFYTRTQKNMSVKVGLHGQSLEPIKRSSETTSASGSQNQPNTVRALNSTTTALSIHIKPGYKSWSTYQVCLETNLNFKSLLTLHKMAVPSLSMV
ncbi:hypothetical protein M9H77_06370 [Catharanthus roseus]|uniref:Uncharacterized protein n=1 Tax=Catharanthus roseus TaxID=4058 RepID=A0ACC0BS12_CATRO|nr:hypothetical protein M9H77_06370 [Catharanthus roseus]